MARLERIFQNAPYPQKSEPFTPFHSCLRDYHSQAISRLCTHTYSKLEAVRQLTMQAPDCCETKDIVRALLTDRGLLFPQTRERFYTEIGHSWRINEEYMAIYIRNLQNMGMDKNTDLTTRVQIFARQAYDSRDFSISFERVSQALDSMLRDSKEYCFPQIVTCEDVGYCKAELGGLDQSSAHLSAAESIMESWLQTVQLMFDGKTTVSGYDYLRTKLNFTVTEAFEFLSDILPPCIALEEQYQFYCTHICPYEPVLYDNQKPDWQQQIHCFHSEDLSSWREALPALEQYLNPDLTRFGRNACPGDFSELDVSRYETFLQDAFLSYLNHMEPQNEPVDVQTIASYFVCSVCGQDNEAPLFMDMPVIIFHLFRSPVFRYFYQYEDRNWNLRKAIENACIHFPLPITPQSLEADSKLYLAIVAVCEEYCHARNITFDAPSWRALWTCIRQCVMCLSFQKEDLFTVRYYLRNLLFFHEKGYPLLDRILSDKLEAESSSAYISLWRALINQKLKGKSTPEELNAAADNASTGQRHPKHIKDLRLNELCQAISTYRKLFERCTTDATEVFQCLWPLCFGVGFNKIAFLPSHEELVELAKEWGFPPRSEKSSFHAIKTTRNNQEGQTSKQQGKKKKFADSRTIELILAEWLMLQWSCEQAQLELMAVIVTLLKE